MVPGNTMTTVMCSVVVGPTSYFGYVIERSLASTDIFHNRLFTSGFLMKQNTNMKHFVYYAIISIGFNSDRIDLTSGIGYLGAIGSYGKHSCQTFHFRFNQEAGYKDKSFCLLCFHLSWIQLWSDQPDIWYT